MDRAIVELYADILCLLPLFEYYQTSPRGLSDKIVFRWIVNSRAIDTAKKGLFFDTRSRSTPRLGRPTKSDEAVKVGRKTSNTREQSESLRFFRTKPGPGTVFSWCSLRTYWRASGEVDVPRELHLSIAHVLIIHFCLIRDYEYRQVLTSFKMQPFRRKQKRISRNRGTFWYIAKDHRNKRCLYCSRK